MVAEEDAVPVALMMLIRVGQLHEAFVRDECARRDLTSADFRVLAFLQMHGAEVPASPTLIASWIVQTTGGLTATLRRLTERGLVERVDDPDDGRGKLVAVTAEGVAAFEAVFSDAVTRFGQMADGIDLSAVVQALAPVLAAHERAASRPRSSSWPGASDFRSFTNARKAPA